MDFSHHFSICSIVFHVLVSSLQLSIRKIIVFFGAVLALVLILASVAMITGYSIVAVPTGIITV